VDPRVELNRYAAVDNVGVAVVENAAKEMFDPSAMTLSPFDRSTFELLVRAAGVESRSAFMCRTSLLCGAARLLGFNRFSK
jgi:hypothetical protein